MFDETTVERIRLIKLQDMGLSLEEIDAMLRASGEHATCAHEAEHIRSALARTEEKLAAITKCEGHTSGELSLTCRAVSPDPGSRGRRVAGRLDRRRSLPRLTCSSRSHRTRSPIPRSRRGGAAVSSAVMARKHHAALTRSRYTSSLRPRCRSNRAIAISATMAHADRGVPRVQQQRPVRD